MSQRYTLEMKVDALNQLDEADGDILLVSEKLDIPSRTLSRWRKNEYDLRRAYNQKRKRHIARLKAKLQTDMLDKGLKIVAQMDDETLAKAPLNQLATALGSLVNHAIKLDEVIDDTDEQQERIIRFEYFYDGEVKETPPWAEEGDEPSRTLQDHGMWETMGQNTPRKIIPIRHGIDTWETRMVASPDAPDGDTTLEGIEDPPEGFEERDWYHD